MSQPDYRSLMHARGLTADFKIIYDPDGRPAAYYPSLEQYGLGGMNRVRESTSRDYLYVVPNP